MANNPSRNGQTKPDHEDRQAMHWTDERDTDRYGQGQSGYGAGRHGGDPSMRESIENRNSAHRSERDAGRTHRENGVDDRWTGRGGREWNDDDRGYRSQGGSPERQIGTRYAHGQQGPGQGPYADQGSHRGKGPQNFTRSDDRIREQACEALTDDHHVDASHIEVIVKNGDVILTGTVADRRQKRAAEDCIDHLAGVRDVQNQLRIEDRERARSNQSRDGAVSTNETDTDTKHRA